MNFTKQILILTLLLLLFGCNNEKELLTDEHKIINDLFLSILDETYIWSKDIIPPPPPPDDTISINYTEYKRLVEKHHDEWEKARNDTSKIYVACSDSLKPSQPFYYSDSIHLNSINKELPNDSCRDAFELLVDGKKEAISFNKSQITNAGRYELIYLSEIDKGNLWVKNSKIKGVIGFSRVYLNSSNTTGILYFNYMCGSQCGEGLLVCFEKMNGIWKINKIIELWIS